MTMSDSDLIDQVNPFLTNMPGSWSQPYYFEGYMKMPDSDKEDECPSPSPACEMATTAGDKQIDWCKPGEPNCPMSRELEPTQKVDPDISYEDRGDIPFGIDFGVVKQVIPRKLNRQVVINLIILLIFIILLVKLTAKL
jgi:hypothetical protein